jgi:hypothetical protein
MKKLLRAAFLVTLALSATVMTTGASQFNTPSITGLSAYVVIPGQTYITLTGDRFSSDFAGDCNFAGRPTVHFVTPDTFDHQVQPDSGNSDQCTNQTARVRVPNLGPSAKVYLTDPYGHNTNTSGSGFYPQVTAQPSGVGLSPSSGQVGTQVSVVGNNLHPPTLAGNPNYSLTIGGAGRSASFGNSIGFTPGNTSGVVHVSFNVSGDANNNNNQVSGVGVDAGTYTFNPPSLQTGSLGGHVVGDRLNLAGANLGSGGSVSFPGGVGGQGISWSSGAIGVTIPPGAQSGRISVSVNGYGAITGPSVSLNPLSNGITPGSGSAGTPVTIRGYNFGGSPGKVNTGGVDQAVNSWAEQAVTFTLSNDSDTGSTVLTRADGVAASAVAFDVVPHLDKLESNNVTAGSQVVVDGTSLGAETGSAKVGGQPATPLLWSRTSVLLALPTDIRPGSQPVSITSAHGGTSNTLPITVVAGKPANAAGAAAAGGSTGGGAAAPSFDNNHTFVKPPKTDSPVQLNVSADPHEARPGSVVDVVVTLTLNGKPVNGAEIKLSMLASPANDYQFTPETGATDATGTFKAKVKISGKPGENVILAQSGVFSDQDHVTGTGATSPLPVGVQAPAGIAGAALFGVGLLAVACVAGALFLQLRSIRLLAP